MGKGVQYAGQNDTIYTNGEFRQLAFLDGGLVDYGDMVKASSSLHNGTLTIRPFGSMALFTVAELTEERLSLLATTYSQTEQ